MRSQRPYDLYRPNPQNSVMCYTRAQCNARKRMGWIRESSSESTAIFQNSKSCAKEDPPNTRHKIAWLKRGKAFIQFPLTAVLLFHAWGYWERPEKTTNAQSLNFPLSDKREREPRTTHNRCRNKARRLKLRLGDSNNTGHSSNTSIVTRGRNKLINMTVGMAWPIVIVVDGFL